MVYRVEKTKNGYVVIPQGPNRDFPLDAAYVAVSEDDIPAIIRDYEASVNS